MLQLFSWMSASETEVTFSQQRVTKAILESQQAEAVIRKRKLIGDLHRARLGSFPVSDIAVAIDQCKAYLDFLTSCLTLVEAEISSFFLALQLLLNEGNFAKNEAKINNLFRYLLRENKSAALAFYHANPDKFAELGQIKRMITVASAIDNVKEQLDALNLKLRTETNPLGIAPFFKNFDEPEQFAAIILWFIQRGIPADQIIKTNLLQNYMAYHLAWGYDIKYLYELLREFPEANALIERAEKEQCTARGFYSYSLTGTLCATGALTLTTVDPPKFEFTLTAANLVAMYQLFGEAFLYQAVVASLKYESSEWENALKDVLNCETTELSHLVTLINETGKTGPSPALEKLAMLISDATIARLFVKHTGAVLHFLPYKASLIEKISETDITIYLKQLQSLNDNIFNQVPQLIALLNAFKHAANQTVALAAYKLLLDTVTQHPIFLEDPYVVKRLQKFSQADAILNTKCARIQAEFNERVTELMRLVPWTVDTYYLIEDAWTECTQQLTLLAKIKAFSHSCPVNIYQLQAQLVKKYVLAHSDFVLDEFIKTLGVDLEFLPARINHYEHLLIEILASVDNETIRAQIIAKLEADEVKKPQWKRAHYSGETILEKASIQGNSGYIKSIAPGELDVAAKITIVTKAVEAGHWHIVEYVLAHETSPLPQANLKELLTRAAKAGQLPTVKLCLEAITRIEQKLINSVLQAAAQLGHPEIAAYFCSAAMPPNSTLLASAAKTAIQYGQYAVIEVIDNLSENMYVLATIDKELGNAAESNKLEDVQHLCTLKNNPPTQTAIEGAFIKAILGGFFVIATYLCHLPKNSPREKAIDIALNEVVSANECLPAVKYLCGLYPSQKAIEQVLKKAAGAGQLDVVSYLSDYNPTIKSQVLTDAIKKAEIGGHTAVALYLTDVLKIRRTPRLSSVSTLSLASMCSPLGLPESASPEEAVESLDGPPPLPISDRLKSHGIFAPSSNRFGVFSLADDEEEGALSPLCLTRSSC